MNSRTDSWPTAPVLTLCTAAGKTVPLRRWLDRAAGSGFPRRAGHRETLAKYQRAGCGDRNAVADALHEIHPQIVWAKFEALAEGARRATTRLW